MKDRMLKWVSVLSALALVTGVVITTANAHIGVGHSPFTTEGPDLRSAEISDEDVLFCFDEEVAEIVDEDGFEVFGFDSATTEPSDSADLGTDDECVEAGFDMDRELEQFTVAGLAEGAVEDRSGNENVEATAPLEGNERDGEEEGDTDAPNLIDTEVDEDTGTDLGTVTYMFDEDIDCTTLDFADFGFYDNDGEFNDGDAEEGCEDNEAEIEFDETAGEIDVDDLERAVVNEGGATSLDPSSEPNTFESDDGTTDVPDLEEFDRTDDDEFSFGFDEEVDDASIDDASFHVIEPDGTVHTAAAAACSEEDGSSVECSIPALEDAEDTDIAMGSVEDGAVDSDDTAEPSTIGNAPMGDAIDPTGTDGPDLEACEIDVEEELVSMFFDERIDEDDSTGGDTNVFDEDGNTSAGGDIDDSDEENGLLVVEFDQDALEDAVGCHVDAGATEDFQTNANVEAAVGTGTAASPSPSSTSPTSTPPTTPPPTTPQPRTVREDSNVSLNYNRPLFGGRVSSGRAECARSRRVVIKQVRGGRDRTIGDDVTNARGVFKIRKRVRRGRFYAVAQRKVFTANNGDTVICTQARSGRERVRRGR